MHKDRVTSQATGIDNRTDILCVAYDKQRGHLDENVRHPYKGLARNQAIFLHTPNQLLRRRPPQSHSL